MKKERLIKLAGLQLNEGVDPNKKYPITVDILTPKKSFAELSGVIPDMISDGELPEGSKLTIDMLTDDVMKVFVKGINIMYDGPRSENAMADNYGEAQYNTIMAAFKKRR